MRLQRLDDPTNPDSGGVLCQFPSQAQKVLAWSRAGYIQDTYQAAQHAMTQLVDHMLKLGLTDDLDRTNIPSAVAAIQRIMMDHNEAWIKARGGIDGAVTSHGH